MKILADENIESAMVAWLRTEGHDVVWAAEDLASTPDGELLDLANESARVLMTRDLDFGELAYREQRVSAGIVLLRLHAPNQYRRLEFLQR